MHALQPVAASVQQCMHERMQAAALIISAQHGA